MSIHDALLVLSDAQAETTVAAHDSTNTLDIGIGSDFFGTARGNTYGENGRLWINVKVVTAFTSGGSATLDVALHDSADDATFAATEVTAPQLAVASLVDGYEILRMPLPSTLKRYVKLVYTIGTAVMTAGAVDAWVSIGPGTPTTGMVV